MDLRWLEGLVWWLHLARPRMGHGLDLGLKIRSVQGGGGRVVNDGCLFLRHRGLAPVAILCLSMSNKTVLAISDV